MVDYAAKPERFEIHYSKLTIPTATGIGSLLKNVLNLSF
jgi:hypothetical protein